jgi:hypothetical protein
MVHVNAPRHLAVPAALRSFPGRLSIRRQLATTPGRLRLCAALLALGAIVFGFVASQAAGTRRHAVADVETTEPLLVSAVDLSAFLSDAHATAAASFLVGVPEPATSRRSYAQLMQKSAAGVATLAGEIGTSSQGGAAVQRITENLPVYAGLIDNARANFRQGFPVGSAYLRRASKTLRESMLPRALELYGIEARKLTKSYEAGVAASAITALLIAGGAMLALLAVTQVYICRATRRIVNPGLALASAVLLGLMAWTVAAFAQQQSQLADAQHKGSDPVELLTATRILALRAQADESIALAARGGGEGEPTLAAVDKGFEAVTKPIGISRPGSALGSRGLLDAAAAIAGDSPETTARIDAIYTAYRRYLEAHSRVVQKECVGNFTAAIGLAVGSATGRRASTDHTPSNCAASQAATVGTGADRPSTRAAAATLNDALTREVVLARRHFDHAASQAESKLGGLAVGIPLLTALCALLALFGVRQRMEEYR